MPSPWSCIIWSTAAIRSLRRHARSITRCVAIVQSLLNLLLCGCYRFGNEPLITGYWFGCSSFAPTLYTYIIRILLKLVEVIQKGTRLKRIAPQGMSPIDGISFFYRVVAVVDRRPTLWITANISYEQNRRECFACQNSLWMLSRGLFQEGAPICSTVRSLEFRITLISLVAIHSYGKRKIGTAFKWHTWLLGKVFLIFFGFIYFFDYLIPNVRKVKLNLK